MFRGERDQRHRGPLGAARRAAHAREGVAGRRRRATSSPRCTRCSTGWPRSPSGFARASGAGTPGKPIRNVVNIGIGGSDLGPGDGLRGAAPLRAARPDVPVRLERRLDRLRRGDPRPRPRRDAVHRLLEDVHDARDDDERPLGARLGARGARATRRRSRSTSSPSRRTPRRCAKFGIDTANMFGFWDWVGGRYSMDSAIGLSTMLAIGPERLPRAARRASTRWTSTSARRRSSGTCPVLMGLLAVWYGDFFGAQTVGVMPYEQYLKRFPAYLQQLTMESNGKHVTLDGAARRLRDGRRLLGRAGHERPAQLLPADPPGHEADPGRPDRLRADAQPARRPPRHPDVERLRPGRGARVREDRGRGARRGHGRGGRAAPRVRGQPPDERRSSPSS